MGLNVKLGCSNCNYYIDSNIKMPFSSSSVLCPKCRELDSMYIVTIYEHTKVKDIHNLNAKVMLEQLQKIRQF